MKNRDIAEKIIATVDDVIRDCTDDEYVAATIRIAEVLDEQFSKPRPISQEPCYWAALGPRWRTSHEAFLPVLKLGPFCPECGRRIQVLSDEG